MLLSVLSLFSFTDDYQHGPVLHKRFFKAVSVFLHCTGDLSGVLRLRPVDPTKDDVDTENKWKNPFSKVSHSYAFLLQPEITPYNKYVMCVCKTNRQGFGVTYNIHLSFSHQPMSFIHVKVG